MCRACAIQYVKVFLCSCLHAVCGTCIFFTLASRRTIHQRCFLSPFRSYNPDAHRGQQELVVLRGVDPQQREGVDLRRAAQGPEDVDDFRWQHDCHPGGLEACGRAVHGYVPPEGFPPLVRFCFFFFSFIKVGSGNNYFVFCCCCVFGIMLALAFRNTLLKFVYLISKSNHSLWRMSWFVL